MITRFIEKKITQRFFKGKAIIIYGARQVGKTTLIKKLAAKKQGKSLYLNCDEPQVRSKLTEANSKALKAVVGNNNIVFIDEAQRIKNIGITLKLLIDNYPDIQIVATGSSSFDLANKINEPLTGRKYEFLLFPFSLAELSAETSFWEEDSMLENRLIFGLYPEIIIKQGEEKELLLNLTSSYLFKDVFSFKDIRHPEIFEKLMVALALQLGNEVSYNELANYVGIDKETIAKYITLLEQAFIIFRLPSFSRNLRNELKKNRKIYFYDNGIRNAIISNFNPLNLRNDKGALWENFLISERKKINSYTENYAKSFFWRTFQQQEIDYIEERDGKIIAYEFKLKKNKKIIPSIFLKAYPGSVFDVITKDNYNSFIGIK